MLLDQATESFAGELKSLLSDVLGMPVKLNLDTPGLGADRVAITPADFSGIPISINGQPVFLLQFKYLCELHPVSKRLTVVSSAYKVLPTVGAPLWHYDYVRDMKKSPSVIAHLNVHAHRNEIVAAMGLAKKISFKKLEIQTLHFPFGGPRFRPTIEDVLQMLISEFGIDTSRNASAQLKKSRAKYFERQLESAIFDAPDSAAKSLRQMGYSVEPPSLL